MPMFGGGCVRVLAKESDDLCNALALLVRSLCSRFYDPSVLVPLLACHLITIDKNPGVRPIGI